MRLRFATGHCVFVFALVVLLISATTGVAAEKFPVKPVKYVIGWGPGGGSDIVGRLLCTLAEKNLGKPIIVQNMPGGSGAKAYTFIAKSKPDGYTIGNCTSTISTHRFMGNIPIGSPDFEPIIAFNFDPGGIWVRKEAPWNNLKEFVDYVKKNPGKVTIAASNPGSITRLELLALEQSAGLEFRILSQRGGAGKGPVALAGGHVDACQATPLEGFSMYKAGKIKPLGVMSDERVRSTYPDLPTYKEQGFPLVMSSLRMVLAPKGTPKDRIEILYNAFYKAIHTEKFRASLENRGSNCLDWRPEKCVEYLKEQDALFMDVIKKAGLYKPK